MEELKLSDPEDSEFEEEQEEDQEEELPSLVVQPTIKVGTKDIPRGATEGMPKKGKQRLKEIAKRSREEEVELIKESIRGKNPK